MDRTNVEFAAVFAAAVFAGVAKAAEEGNAPLAKQLAELGTKSGACAIAGTPLTQECLTLAAAPELVVVAKAEKPAVADLVELVELGTKVPAEDPALTAMIIQVVANGGSREGFLEAADALCF